MLMDPLTVTVQLGTQEMEWFVKVRILSSYAVEL